MNGFGWVPGNLKKRIESNVVGHVYDHSPSPPWISKRELKVNLLAHAGENLANAKNLKKRIESDEHDSHDIILFFNGDYESQKENWKLPHLYRSAPP